MEFISTRTHGQARSMPVRYRPEEERQPSLLGELLYSGQHELNG